MGQTAQADDIFLNKIATIPQVGFVGNFPQPDRNILFSFLISGAGIKNLLGSKSNKTNLNIQFGAYLGMQ